VVVGPLGRLLLRVVNRHMGRLANQSCS
jgi:hypothetical protein